MANDRSPSEWPLVIFTLGVQVAAAAMLVCAASEIHDGWNGTGGGRAALFPGALAFGVAMLASLFHLGRPGGAWKSLSNLAHSPLSREILLTGAFGLAACVHTGLVFSSVSAVLPFSSALAAGVGLAAVAQAASVYTVPARPVWHRGWVTFSFLAVTVLLAGCALAVIPGAGLTPALRTLLLGALLVGGVSHGAAAIRMVSVATRLAKHQAEVTGGGDPAILNTPAHKWALAAQLTLGSAWPVLLASYLLTADVGTVTLAHPFGLAAALVAPLVGAACGRHLMYSLGTRIPRF
jgi:anaerobic dimethyl sulfoxide reductase subunit C